LVEFCFNKPIKNRNEVCTLHKCFASSSWQLVLCVFALC
jgi:hypothetical protein